MPYTLHYIQNNFDEKEALSIYLSSKSLWNNAITGKQCICQRCTYTHTMPKHTRLTSYSTCNVTKLIHYIFIYLHNNYTFGIQQQQQQHSKMMPFNSIQFNEFNSDHKDPQKKTQTKDTKEKTVTHMTE